MGFQPLAVLQTDACNCCSPSTADMPAAVPTTALSSATTSTTQNSHTTATKENAMSTQTFQVTGMTCNHCAGAVTSELKNLTGVTDVQVKLVAGGISPVTVISQAPVEEQDVAAALDEAGDYHLANS